MDFKEVIRLRRAVLTFSILAFLALIVLPDPDAWAAPGVFTRTDAQSEAELDAFLSKVSGDMTALSRLNFKDGLKKSKYNFLRLYFLQWRALGMSRRLEMAIDTAFEEQTGELIWGTAGLQLAVNRNNIIEDIQEAAAFKFSPSYDAFLKALENEWAPALQKDIAKFYERDIIEYLAGDKNPMSQAWLRQNHNDITRDGGKLMMENLRVSMKSRYPDLTLAGTGFALGLAGVFFQNKLRSYIVRLFFKKGMRSAAGKIAGTAIPIVNMIMMLWGAYDILSVAWEAKDEVRRQLIEINQALYSDEVPYIFWDVMEPYVRDFYVASYMESQAAIHQSQKLSKDPRIVALSEGLSEPDRQRFSDRVAAIVREFGGADYGPLLQDFGPIIRDASPANFTRFSSMLRQGNLQQMKAWFALAGETRYYDLYASFPQSVWAKYPPNDESLVLLLWMAQNLTPHARSVACDLPVEDLRWLMDEMPPRYISRLFNERYGVSAIHDEIARLAALPDRDPREPWQGKWEYRWSKYGFYLLAAIGTYILIIVFRFAWKLFVLSSSVGSRIKDRDVTINLAQPSAPPPPRQEALPSPRSGHEVRLRASAALAPQLSTIMWNSSQRILPSKDGQSWILSVTLEDLDEIAQWISRNEGEIEVLQPDSLKRAVRSRQGGSR